MEYVVWETTYGSHIFKVNQDGVQTLIVFQTDNLGKQEYLDWVALGNEPTDLILN
jgi:hypothetical protein